ncbi:MAG: quinolinate synthase NadA, partial [Thermodesulfovibrionales bacterium]
LKTENPGKEFFALRKDMICPNMKRTTLQSILRAFQENTYVVKVPEEIRVPAKRALDRMLEIK